MRDVGLDYLCDFLGVIGSDLIDIFSLVDIWSVQPVSLLQSLVSLLGLSDIRSVKKDLEKTQ